MSLLYRKIYIYLTAITYFKVKWERSFPAEERLEVTLSFSKFFKMGNLNSFFRKESYVPILLYDVKFTYILLIGLETLRIAIYENLFLIHNKTRTFLL